MAKMDAIIGYIEAAIRKQHRANTEPPAGQINPKKDFRPLQTNVLQSHRARTTMESLHNDASLARFKTITVWRKTD